MKIDHDTHPLPLTDEGLAAYRPNKQVMRYLRHYTERSGRLPRDLKVLDMGCGTGALLITLKRLGYRAYGADIDAHSLDVCRAWLGGHGHALDSVSAIDERNRTAFGDASFDLIVSNQTVEHVEDLAIFAAECARLTRPGGWNVHSLPGRYNLMEPHISVPFVHWIGGGGGGGGRASALDPVLFEIQGGDEVGTPEGPEQPGSGEVPRALSGRAGLLPSPVARAGRVPPARIRRRGRDDHASEGTAGLAVDSDRPAIASWSAGRAQPPARSPLSERSAYDP